VVDDFELPPSATPEPTGQTSKAMRWKLDHAEFLQERMQLALKAGHIGTYDFDPRTQRATWDAELYAIWGIDPDVEDVFAALQPTIHPDDAALWEENVARSLDPEGSRRHDVTMRITRPDTGEQRWVHAQGDVTFESGVPIRLIGAVRDVTEEKRAEERERLLSHELNHRMENAFAVISSIVRATQRMSDTTEGMGQALLGRIDAMSRAHGLIKPSIDGQLIEDADAELRALCSSILEPHRDMADDPRIVLHGPTAMLSPRAASAFALVLHEWATNAAKYGSLRVPDGRLSLFWTAPSGGLGTVEFVWEEAMGPGDGQPPSKIGFGTRLVDATLQKPLFTDFRTDWVDRGLVQRVTIQTKLA
jgi:two-component sensor histidine kinase